MQHYQYVMNDNDMREREVQLARQRQFDLAAKYNQQPKNTFRKPPKFKKGLHVIEWIIIVGALAGVVLFLIS